MNADRAQLLKSYRQVAGATARLAKLCSGSRWPLAPAQVDHLLARGAIVEGMKIENKEKGRHSPGWYSAMSACVAMHDIATLEKFLDAPPMDRPAFDKDVSSAWWASVQNQSLPALRTLVLRKRLISCLSPPDALSLLSRALVVDFIPGARMLIDAGIKPALAEYELSGRILYHGVFSSCRSARAVQLLVDCGVAPSPPPGHEHSLSDLAQILDHASYKDDAERQGAVGAVIELIKLGYPIDNVPEKGGSSLASNIQKLSHRAPASVLAPLASYVEPILPQISSGYFYSPRGVVTLLDAGFAIDLDKVARNWNAWLSGSAGMDKPSLGRLLDEGMPGPGADCWGSLECEDEFGHSTGELDRDLCLDLIELGVDLEEDIKARLLMEDARLSGKIEIALATASARRLNRKTGPLGPAAAARRM